MVTAIQGPIAIDYTPALSQGGGIGRYTRDLVAALAEQDRATDYRLFVAGSVDTERMRTPAPNFHWVTTSLDPVWLARLWHRFHVPLPIERWTGDIRLLHAPDFTLPPVRRRTKTILTVHDLSFIREPWTAAPGLRSYLGRVVPRSIARADCILADSESTRQDLIEIYRTSDLKIRVLYSGVPDQFYPIQDQVLIKRTLDHYGIGSDPFILAVGTIQPRKNYDRLIEAFHQIGRRDVKLVIAGARGWLDSPLYRRVAELKMEQDVQFLGFVPDHDLPILYSAARVFAFPSLYEGFGLPPLEAMACGAPVLTSNRSSLPEVVGDAALMVDPYDVEAIKQALIRLLDDEGLRNMLINRGQLRAQRFTWRTAARQLREIYAEILG